MRLDKIPRELRERAQWVVWRSVIRRDPNTGQDKITKPPFRSSDPSREADSTDPSSWGTFDEAVECHKANSSVVSGIGFVFSEDDPYFGVDVDDEAKVKPEHLTKRREFVERLLREVVTYTEVSPSGQGLHLIGLGRMPVAGTQARDLNIELYHHKRFFTITGNVLDDARSDITDQQAFIDQLGLSERPEDQRVGDAQDRKLDLSDEQVIALAADRNPSFLPRFNGQIGCDPGEWSETFMAIVGMIDDVTGSVAQVERIIMGSPMVMLVKNSGSGETRVNKAKRILPITLARVRRGNDALRPFVDHGRQIVEAIDKAKEERAKRTFEAVRAAEAAIGRMSKGSASLLDAFPTLKHEHKVLTRPPGVVGEFVEATEGASHLPFMKFAIPATLAALAGVLGRSYKLPGGSGLNLNFILAAPSSTGKTQTMKAWERFFELGSRNLPATPSGPPKNRIINSSTSSIQAMMTRFADVPSCAWFVEECASQLSAMSGAKTVVEAALRDAYNQLYDASSHSSMFSGPMSVSAQKANLTAINNLSVSTFWTTTTSKFDVFADDALDGFLSRVVVVRHSGPGGEPNQFPQPLAPHLVQQLADRLGAATQVDDAYRIGSNDGARMLTTVSTDAVVELSWQHVRISNTLSNAAIRGDLPEPYTAISRLPLAALRIAAILAIMDSPYNPSITELQYKWAFGYLLQNIVALLSDMDKGEIGQKATDDTLVVVKVMRELMHRPEHRGLPGVPRKILREALKWRKPFVSSPLGGSKAVGATIIHMLADGQVEEVSETIQTQQGRGRPRTFLVPVENDPIWG